MLARQQQHARQVFAIDDRNDQARPDASCNEALREGRVAGIVQRQQHRLTLFNQASQEDRILVVVMDAERSGVVRRRIVRNWLEMLRCAIKERQFGAIEWNHAVQVLDQMIEDRAQIVRSGDRPRDFVHERQTGALFTGAAVEFGVAYRQRCVGGERLGTCSIGAGIAVGQSAGQGKYPNHVTLSAQRHAQPFPWRVR